MGKKNLFTQAVRDRRKLKQSVDKQIIPQIKDMITDSLLLQGINDDTKLSKQDVLSILQIQDPGLHSQRDPAASIAQQPSRADFKQQVSDIAAQNHVVLQDQQQNRPSPQQEQQAQQLESDVEQTDDALTSKQQRAQQFEQVLGATQGQPPGRTIQTSVEQNIQTKKLEQQERRQQQQQKGETWIPQSQRLRQSTQIDLDSVTQSALQALSQPGVLNQIVNSVVDQEGVKKLTDDTEINIQVQQEIQGDRGMKNRQIGEIRQQPAIIEQTFTQIDKESGKGQPGRPMVKPQTQDALNKTRTDHIQMIPRQDQGIQVDPRFKQEAKQQVKKGMQKVAKRPRRLTKTAPDFGIRQQKQKPSRKHDDVPKGKKLLKGQLVKQNQRLKNQLRKYKNFIRKMQVEVTKLKQIVNFVKLNQSKMTQGMFDTLIKITQKTNNVNVIKQRFGKCARLLTQKKKQPSEKKILHSNAEKFNKLNESLLNKRNSGSSQQEPQYDEDADRMAELAGIDQ